MRSGERSNNDPREYGLARKIFPEKAAMHLINSRACLSVITWRGYLSVGPILCLSVLSRVQRHALLVRIGAVFLRLYSLRKKAECEAETRMEEYRGLRPAFMSLELNGLAEAPLLQSLKRGLFSKLYSRARNVRGGYDSSKYPYRFVGSIVDRPVYLVAARFGCISDRIPIRFGRRIWILADG